MSALPLVSRLVASFRFLTIFPLPGSLGTDDDSLAGSVPFFPVVGLVLGLLAAASAWLLYRFFPPLPAAALLCLVLLKFSGGLHMDGLADTVDGFFSARPDVQTILTIMRDSRIGAMGVMALVMVLLLKTSALASLDQGQAMVAALLMPLAGRTAIVLMMALLPYARKEGGLATLFYRGRCRRAATGGLLLLVLTTLLVQGPGGLWAVGGTLAVVVLFVHYCRRKIGGATGDTLGAACELAEVIMALALTMGRG